MFSVSKMPPHLRIASRTIVTENGCWEYQGHILKTGYGWASGEIKGKPDFTHRIMYRWARGEITKGTHIDHLCSNRACCNPSHLEMVSPKENARRSKITNANKTHCPKGHEYAPETTYYRKDRFGRQCNICNLENYYRRKTKIALG